jgi:hypothetical protein
MSLPTSVHPVTLRKKREPNGVDKPIALRLRPEERERVQRLAGQRNVSMASVAAEAVRRGLVAMERENRARAADR